MKVCMVCEGSYPYVAGGVSSWVHMLLNEYKDIDFIIYSIGTNEKEMSQYKYKIPDNVKEVRTIYLTGNENKSSKKRLKLSKKDRMALESLMLDSAEDVDWIQAAEFLQKYKNQAMNLVMGKDFYNNCVKMQEKEKIRLPFNYFLWNQRSMYLPIITVLAGEIPEADIYHSVSAGYAGILAGIASSIKNKPFILTEHGIYTREREEEIIKSDWVTGIFKEIWIDFFYKLSAFAYRQANVVTSLFELNKSLQMELGCPKEKIRIIPNGVDFNRFCALPKRYENDQKRFHIGVVARVVPIKDIKTMLYAFELVKEKVNSAHLYILGPYEEDKNYYEECLSLIDELQIRDVYFKGNVRIDEYLPEFDIMLLTSISEGQPLAVLEGMAAGIPQVCTNVGSCKELLYGRKEDALGKAGIIVPVMNQEEMAAAITYLAGNPSLRKEMGMVGMERVKTYYQKQVFLSKYKDLYSEVLKGSNKE